MFENLNRKRKIKYFTASVVFYGAGLLSHSMCYYVQCRGLDASMNEQAVDLMMLDAVASILELEAANMTSDAYFSLLGIKLYMTHGHNTAFVISSRPTLP